MRSRFAKTFAPQSIGAVAVLVALAFALAATWSGLAFAHTTKSRASLASHRNASRFVCHTSATKKGWIKTCVSVTAVGASRHKKAAAQTKKAVGKKSASPKTTTVVTTTESVTTTTAPTISTAPTTGSPKVTASPTPATPKTESASTTTSTTSESPSTESLTSESSTTPGPTSSPGTGTGWDGFGGGSMPGPNWRPYASSSPFNQSAEGAAVANDSAGIVQKVLSWSLPGNLVAGNAETSTDFGHPTFFAEPTDPTYTLEATEPWGSNSLDGMRIQIPAGARPAAGEDAHMTVVEPDGWEYDFWHAQVPPAGGGTFKFGWGGRTRIDGNGLGSAGTAAGFGNLAGMIRAPELAAGKINHALFIVVKCAAKNTSFGYGTTATSTSSYVYPATHGGSACPTEEANLPPMGTHFVLAMSAAQIQALAVPTWKKTILTALAHYGGYVGDTGGPGFGFMFESSTSYTALGQPDPLVTLAKEYGLPTWEGDYVFNVSSGVEWEKYLRVVVPPSE